MAAKNNRGILEESRTGLNTSKGRYKRVKLGRSKREQVKRAAARLLSQEVALVGRSVAVEDADHGRGRLREGRRQHPSQRPELVLKCAAQPSTNQASQTPSVIYIYIYIRI